MVDVFDVDVKVVKFKDKNACAACATCGGANLAYTRHEVAASSFPPMTFGA